jgi:hypothetical protein
MGRLLWRLRKSEERGTFEACCVAGVVKVYRQSDGIVDVDIGNAPHVDWDVDNEILSDPKWDIVWKLFLGWDMSLM